MKNRIRNFLKESNGVYPVGKISYGVHPVGFIDLSYGVNTHVSKKSLAKIKSPLGRFFESKKLNNNHIKKAFLKEK